MAGLTPCCGGIKKSSGCGCNECQLPGSHAHANTAKLSAGVGYASPAGVLGGGWGGGWAGSWGGRTNAYRVDPGVPSQSVIPPLRRTGLRNIIGRASGGPVGGGNPGQTPALLDPGCSPQAITFPASSVFADKGSGALPRLVPPPVAGVTLDMGSPSLVPPRASGIDPTVPLVGANALAAARTALTAAQAAATTIDTALQNAYQAISTGAAPQTATAAQATQQAVSDAYATLLARQTDAHTALDALTKGAAACATSADPTTGQAVTDLAAALTQLDAQTTAFDTARKELLTVPSKTAADQQAIYSRVATAAAQAEAWQSRIGTIMNTLATLPCASAVASPPGYGNGAVSPATQPGTPATASTSFWTSTGAIVGYVVLAVVVIGGVAWYLMSRPRRGGPKGRRARRESRA